MGKILIAEEDPSLTDVLAFDLKGIGLEVLTVFSFQEAQEILEKEDLDIVITALDIQNDHEKTLLDVIKEKDNTKPAVILLSNPTSDSIDELYDRGADAVFGTPYERRAMIDSVNRTLKRLDLPAPHDKQADRIPAKYSIKLDGKNGGAETFNVARGGMFVACEQPVPALDAAIDFELKHDELGVIKGKGVVRWQRKYPHEGLPVGVGVEFLELDSDTKERIAKMVNGAKTRAFIPRS